MVGTWEELAFWLPEADDVQTLVAQLNDYGLQMVVVKQGERGAVGAGWERPGGRVTTVSIDNARVIINANSVGAGDTLNGRLLYELCCGQPLANALEMAVTTATAVVAKGEGVLGLVDD
jgi:sugar/nucleoside kinase (ribokinase family)